MKLLQKTFYKLLLLAILVVSELGCSISIDSQVSEESELLIDDLKQEGPSGVTQDSFAPTPSNPSSETSFPSTESAPSNDQCRVLDQAVSTAISSTDPPPTVGCSLDVERESTCLENQGQIERTAYHGPVLGDQIPVLVYLPPCYAKDDRIYPVLYLLHGKPQNELHWGILGVDEVAESGMAAGTFPPFLMVMPRQPEPLFSSTDGGPTSYEAELVEGLIPFIDKTYRTDPRAQARALAGISRGGVWALEIGLSHPDIFESVIALSPALNVNYPRDEYDPFNIVLYARRLPKNIFLMAGEEDSARLLTDQLSEMLLDAGVNHEFHLIPGNHESATWKTILPKMMEFVVDNWIVE